MFTLRKPELSTKRNSPSGAPVVACRILNFVRKGLRVGKLTLKGTSTCPLASAAAILPQGFGQPVGWVEHGVFRITTWEPYYEGSTDFLISRCCLLSLWWRELFVFAACLGFLSLGATWLILWLGRNGIGRGLKSDTKIGTDVPRSSLRE